LTYKTAARTSHINVGGTINTKIPLRKASIIREPEEAACV
jgi:hypothetical protein